MLPAPARLRRASEFGAVFRQGRSYADSLVILHVLTDRPGPSQVGFSVGKKAGKAVVRNRTRRRLRAIMARWWPEVPEGRWLVLAARAPSAGADYGQLALAVEGLLARAGLRPCSSVDKGERGS